jgi:hypothetical protein
MSDIILHMVLGAFVAGVVGIIIAAIKKYIERRVKVETPVERELRETETRIRCIVPAVNMLVENQGPILQALRALLEAQKGKINGNVDDALSVVIDAQNDYTSFKDAAAKIPLLKTAKDCA